ncbi:MAG: hypothetical protein ACI4LX_01475 [Treponema sp.]
MNAVEVRHTSSTAEQGLSDPAAGISTLNDNSNIPQTEEKSSIRNMLLSDGITYGFTYEEKSTLILML